ncbi:histone-lysine N-methyltransferase PR-Set7-like [Sitodiplosis mosellana]|uniref:histone-lysine N-methyltransferase PR-Set7-like n=1 Tax=Sitodiplosis mosellana TaxID=263140 RepID=UPI0024442F44|nr:histone-lysine N-methyltransferase PR-Set7-like [Sitodiplosis mosellana]XP_055298624.1 histone-lysine N-methyltransferase PR-Set7-like [Sitodiplosis mosellana]XP_055298625.1 histone-lysine N-methyltransferase PR-Set7-like [Sitodiplosis mosellana]XP_055298626.1 histone-lysine N-methyltransferase PR-Set7-like [Sitodiplosis mosellana]XP_055298627.1 histone-lysine N-methyltransferase PR-Set7-like [Sitodiplosis mosellana]
MVRGRRPRIGAAAAAAAAAKGQLKVTTAIGKKECKQLRKMATNGTSDLAIVERTRNLRKSLHKIQKQFDNQAITKFFQRTLKAHSYPRFGSDDENACDAFTADQLNNLSDSGGDGGDDVGNNNELTKSDDDEQEFATLNANANDANILNGDDMKNDEALNLCLINGDRNSTDENSNGNITSISIQPTNIFLQKPVLHLNIDKSQIQASSIVINKHLDACPNFATSFTVFNNSSVLNTANNNNIQSKSSEDESSAEQNDMHAPNDAMANNDQKTKCEKPRLRKRRPRKCASRWANENGPIDVIHDSDSNSCDSGVVSDRSFELSSTDGNKPTTPHRIVCPSISTPTHEDSPKVLPQPNLARTNAIKRPTVKRARGKLEQKGQTVNNAKSYFTKLTAVADAQAKTTNATAPDDNTKADKSKNDVDCEMSALNIESNVDQIVSQIVKCATPKPISRSSTPLQKPMQSKQMTDFFPVRRSIRKTKKVVELEHLRYIEKAIEQQCEDGLVVKYFKEKGRGICAGRPFARGEFVIEYIGDLIDQIEADRREEIYAKDVAFGCYMYYFKHKEQQWCIDATAETGKLGRLVNHSRNGNLVTKIVTYKNRPHLVLIAKENIKEGEELTYDYGDRTRESLVNHPWLAL